MEALKLYAHTQILLQSSLFICSPQISLQSSNSSISSHYFSSSSTSSLPSSSPSSFCITPLCTSVGGSHKHPSSSLWQRSWNFLETWKVLEAHFHHRR